MGRIERVNQQLKREISRIIQQELGDPRLAFVTILNVEVSRDLRYAKIFYSFLGTEDQLSVVQAGLNGACGMIRRLVGKYINMRYTPEFLFIFDKSVGNSARINQALKEIQHEHKKDHPDT